MKEVKSKEGSNRPNRVGISLNHEHDAKLNKLAIACNMKPTTLAGIIVQMALEDASLISYLQDQHNVYPEFKILPVRENGRLSYVIGGIRK